MWYRLNWLTRFAAAVETGKRQTDKLPVTLSYDTMEYINVRLKADE